MRSKFAAKTIYILLIGLFTLFQTASAAPGDMDLTFSQDGIITQSIGDNNYSFGKAMAIQPDGKIIVIGDTSETIVRGCGIARFKTNGSLDTTFDGDGKAFIKGGNPWHCRATVVQIDGKIVIAGFTISDSIFVIVRLKTDGTLDTSFDGDGIVTTSISNNYDEVKAVLIQPDGKIVAVGNSYFSNSIGYAISLVRYNTDGTLDPTFDGDGIVTTSISNIDDVANAATIQPDGKIVVAGTAYLKFAVVRYNPNGSLDTSFDSDGKVTTSISNNPAYGNAVTVKADGKIVVAGYEREDNILDNFAVAQFNPNGSLDTSFDKDGKVSISGNLGLSEIKAVAAQADGKIVAACQNNSVTVRDNSVVCLNSDGSLDKVFDPNSPVDSYQRYSFAALAVQTDGTVVAAGTDYQGYLAALRYNLDGSFDETFDDDGKAMTGVGIPISSANATAIQPDGKIVAVGYTGSGYNFAVVRYNPDGSLDTTFDGDGKVITRVSRDDRANAVAIQPDGKIIASGNVAIVRYNTDGTLDTTFDGDGIVYTIFGHVQSNDIAIQTDGKIVLAGFYHSVNPALDYFAVTRYNPDGTLDTTFDTDGIVLTSLLGIRDIANSVEVQSDGKIVATGFGLNGTNYDFALVRYNPDGSLDTTFDNDGKVITSITSGYDVAGGMTIQNDGKIIAAGISDNAKTALVRYNPNGSLDTTFDNDGMVTTSGSNISANAVVVQADGKILAAGSTCEMDGTHDFGLIRFNSDGSLDSTSYDTGGKVQLDILGGSDDYLMSMALDSVGRAVVVGQANGFFTVARVLTSAAVNTPFDFDGDRKTDISIFRPGAGEWWINRSSTGATVAAQFGTVTDKIVPGDYTGDGKADIAVWRGATGEWFILRSEDNSFYSIPFGINGDVPVPADFDGDTKTDIAVFRPVNSAWYVSKSTGGYQEVAFGAAGDIPVTGNYDGDGKSDIAVFRPSTGAWWILKSTTSSAIAYQFGTGTDIPVHGDYTDDGRTDVAVWRPSTGEWFVQRSEDNTFYSTVFGVASDIPIPGDYDGDGRFDTAVFRPSGATWYINRSTSGILITSFGLGSDKPVPSAFVP